ncbi:MAG: hypothetical protein NC405_05000 [Odoribacter sp.]|nr:hypothetical protein [Odoribacter sp.]
MKFFTSLLILAAFQTALSGCSGDEPSGGESPAPPAARISSIDIFNDNTLDTGRRVYVYDSRERLKSVTETYTSGAGSISCNYLYPDDNHITISTVDDAGNGQRAVYEETATLSGGLVRSISGVMTTYVNGELKRKVNYMFSYEYDNRGRLTSIARSQWDGIHDTQDNPWRWVDSLVWDGDRLLEYTDCNGSSRPVYTYTYTYLDKKIDCQVVVPFTYHAQYDALFQVGCFGVQPPYAVDSRARRGIIGEETVRRYSYTIEDGVATGFQTTINYGTPYKYTITAMVSYIK